MSLATKPTLAALRTSARNELLDPTGRWWSDTELNSYIEGAQAELQRQFEFVWGSSTTTTNIPFFAIDDAASIRMGRVWWNGYQLPIVTTDWLSDHLRAWRYANTSEIPKLAYLWDSGTLGFWPPPSTAGTLVVEYPAALTLSSDTSTLSVPAWTKFAIKDWVGWKAYSRLGPNQDLDRALRRKKRWVMALARFRKNWDAYRAEAAPHLRIGGKHDVAFLEPSTNYGVTMPGIVEFAEVTITGAVNGTNTSYTVPSGLTFLQLYLDGQLLTPYTANPSAYDYTFSGTAVAMQTAPPTGAILRAFGR